MKKTGFCRKRASFTVRTALAATLISAGAAAQVPPTEPAPPAEAPAPVEAPPPVDAAPAEPPAAPPAEVAPAPEPLPEPAPPAAADVQSEPMPMPMPEGEPPPVEEPESKLAPVSVGAWLRVGFKFQNHQDPEKLNDASIDEAYGELHTSGQVHEKVNWTFNLNANGNNGEVHIMDAIIQLDLADPIHVWVGQHLVPSDRSNFSGPFFMSGWNYPGLTGPRQGPTGRNVGATLWGDIGGTGKFKYYAGVFDFTNGSLEPPDDADSDRPLYTGRVNLAIIGEEPGFYHSSTYYGAKDILAIGVGGQYQGQTPAAGENYRMFNADLLAEFSPGGGVAGTITGEGAIYRYQEVVDQATTGLMGLASWLVPGDIAGGRAQLGARYQGRWVEEAENTPVKSINDFWLAYVLNSYNTRITATYTRTYDAGPDPQEITLGFQTIQ